MELRKSVDIRRVAIVMAFLMVLTYLGIGFSTSPAEATKYEISTEITIPAINLESDVTALKLRDGKLDTPDTIVGSFSRANNKIFLVGHATTVFRDLKNLKMEDEIIYDYTTYIVQNIEVLEKAEISMNGLLKEAEVDTLVIMTCFGEMLPGGDATHRLIITAVAR